MSADLWAGAEVQLATVASYLVERRDVELTAVLFNEGPLACELRRLGVPVTVMDEQQNDSLTILIALTRWLGNHPVDVVHTHRYKDTVLGAVAAKLAGVPAIVRTVHGAREPLRGWDWAKFGVYEGLDRLMLRCFADRIVAVSRGMAENLEQSGYRPGTVIPIHNGVDLRKIRPTRARDDVRRELGVALTSPLIGTVGRLSPVKGHAHFLRAARLILQKEPEARFVIVGDGPLRNELASSAKRLGIDEACLFVGARDDVYDLVAAMDAFVLPSLHEGIPMALLEAMAIGTPVVATAVGGVPEIVVHRCTGVLVGCRDEAAMADACLELIGKRDWAQTLSVQARRMVEDAFSHEQNGRALVGAYRAIGADRGRPRARRGRAEGRRGLLSRARKLCMAAVTLPERRRMEQVRRDPSQLAMALRAAKRILIVCQGNIIRSPFTARLVAQAVGEDGRISISSGGLAARPGTPPPPAALLAAARLHVDLDGHRASAVTPLAVATNDIILVMDIAQLVAMRRRFPESRGKTFLLTSLAPQVANEVRDPWGAEDSVFDACYEHISASVRPIVHLIAGRTVGQ